MIRHHHELIQFHVPKALLQSKPFTLRQHTGFVQLHRVVDHLVKNRPALPGLEGDEICRRKGVIISGHGRSLSSANTEVFKFPAAPLRVSSQTRTGSTCRQSTFQHYLTLSLSLRRKGAAENMYGTYLSMPSCARAHAGSVEVCKFPRISGKLTR